MAWIGVDGTGGGGCVGGDGDVVAVVRLIASLDDGGGIGDFEWTAFVVLLLLLSAAGRLPPSLLMA